MTATKAYPFTRVMSCAVRPLKAADIHQSVEIERAAFPTLFPPTSFRRELKNQLASYLVAWRRVDSDEEWSRAGHVWPALPEVTDPTLVGALFRNVRNILTGQPTESEDGPDFIAGFLGTWYMGDQAHIVSVGVRMGCRNMGIGELLLIGAIEQAMCRRSRIVTLEVRPSNAVARNLYRKYGFKDQGVRKNYYADNREDAIIMTTDPILVPPYPELFRKREGEHQQRWDHAERAVL